MLYAIRRVGLAAAAAVLVAGAAGQAGAGQILGGSTLVDAAGLSQLQADLGVADLTLTRIFTHTAGDNQTATDFHAAADGQGPTISVIELLATNGNTHQIIGGYDPQSWDSVSGWHITDTDAERTGFLFNLTSGAVQRQKLNGDANGFYFGQYQTYNSQDYGPTFGGGHDLYVNSALGWGYAYNWSYGTTVAGNIITGLPYDGSYLDYGTLEVFTVSTAEVAAVPEPSTLAGAGLAALAGLGYAWRRRRAA